MKTTIFTAAFLILGTVWMNAQSPAVVCMDNISISSDSDFLPEQRKFDQLVNVLIFGLDEKASLNVAEQTSYKVSQPQSVMFRFDSSLISKADYALRGRVFLSGDAAFTFNVRDLKSGKTHYLPPVHSSIDDLLKGSSEVANNLYELISELNAARPSPGVRLAIIGDIKAEGKGKITEEEALSALYSIVDRKAFAQYGKLISNDSLRTFSFRNRQEGKPTNANGTQITLKLNFSKSKEGVVMLPVVYCQYLIGDSLKLVQSVFDLHDNRQMNSEKYDLLSLMDFIISGNQLNTANVKSLETLMTTTTLPSLQTVTAYLDSAASGSDYIYKTLLLIKKKIELEGEDYDTYIALSKLRQIQKRTDDASASLVIAAENTGDKTAKANAFAQAASINYAAGRFFDAVSFYETIGFLDPNFNSQEFGELNFLKGRLYCKLSRYDDASSYLEKSLSVKPLKPGDFPYENMYWLGFVYFYQGRTKDAIDNLQRVYDWNKTYAEMLPVYLSDCYRNLAQENLTKANYIEAFDQIQQSLRFKENRDSQLMLLKILNRLARINESRQYIATNLNEPAVWRFQAKDLKVLFYGRHKNEFALEAISLYRRYLAQRTTDSLAMYDLGNLYTVTNRIDSALFYFENARATGYKQPNLYLDMAEAYIKKNNPQRALEVLKTSGNGKNGEFITERNNAIRLYLIVVSKRLMKLDYSSEDLQLHHKFQAKTKVVSSWDFQTLRNSIQASDASNDDKQFINTLTQDMIGISVEGK